MLRFCYIIAKLLKQFYYLPNIRFFLLHNASRLVNSRGYELDWAIKYLPQRKSRVIDIGATESLFIYKIKSLGHDAYALDKRPYQEEVRGFSFMQLDLTRPNAWQGNPVFDCATAISTLEHIGRGDYGDRIDEENGLRVAVKNIADMLVPEGRLIATFPHSWREYTNIEWRDAAEIIREVSEHFKLLKLVQRDINTLTLWKKK